MDKGNRGTSTLAVSISTTLNMICYHVDGQCDYTEFVSEVVSTGVYGSANADYLRGRGALEPAAIVKSLLSEAAGCSPTLNALALALRPSHRSTAQLEMSIPREIQAGAQGGCLMVDSSSPVRFTDEAVSVSHTRLNHSD